MENSRYLIFTSAGRSFSLPFEDIKIIIAAQTPTPVPDFPDYVPGTVVNEGEVVPVIDCADVSTMSQKRSPTEIA